MQCISIVVLTRSNSLYCKHLFAIMIIITKRFSVILISLFGKAVKTSQSLKVQHVYGACKTSIAS